MDLLRGTGSKKGVRGGQADFDWSSKSVKDNSHLSNYLGHSLKAPKGKWAHGRDLEWFARAERKDNTDPWDKDAERKAIKAAEKDALNLALGLSNGTGNANDMPLGRRHVTQASDRLRSPEKRHKRNRERHRGPGDGDDIQKPRPRRREDERETGRRRTGSRGGPRSQPYRRPDPRSDSLARRVQPNR
ncbi:hypothetical protein PYCC9005_002120 [Savitreella phatthalungensis]